MLETIAETLRATIAVGLVLAGILAILIWVRNLTKKLNNLRLFTQIAASIAIFVFLLFWPIPWNPILSCLIFSIALSCLSIELSGKPIYKSKNWLKEE